MKTTVNRYWVLNLWEALDGETVEVHCDASRFLSLEMADPLDRETMIRGLLLPALSFFGHESKERIRLSLFYNAAFSSEQELLALLNYFGGTVFESPSALVTCRDFYKAIGHSLFGNFDIKNVSCEEDSDGKNYRLS